MLNYCWLKSGLGASAGNGDRIVSVKTPATTSNIASWVKQSATDHVGDDIACFQDGSPGSKCAALCSAHGSCKAYGVVNGALGGAWSKGGCCVKTVGTPTASSTYVDFYTGTK